PTVSAVNIPHGMEHPFQIVPGTGANTGFDKYFISSTNTPYVDITPEIDAFLLDQLPRPFQAPLLQLALTGVDNHPYVFGSWDGTNWLHRQPGPTLPDFTLPVASSLAAGGNTLYLGLLVTSPFTRIFFFFSTDSIHWYPA